MGNNDIVNEWLELANKDIASSKFLTQMHPAPLEIICYHCQQSAEKYLKAYLISNDREIIRTHDLTILNNLCKSINKNFSLFDEVALRLTDFGVNIRYPYPLELTREDMEQAIKDAELLQDFINDILDKKESENKQL